MHAADRVRRRMKIAVCAKVVPEQARRIDPQTKRLDRSGEQALNPFDANAVEEALRLKGNDADAEVVLVSHEAAAGSDLVASSYALARALDREQADLVLFGQQANDSDGAVMWAAVADRLRRPLISQVAELTVSDGTLRGKRQTEFGYDVIEAPLPAVVAVSDAINEPRYPSLIGIMGAKSKPQDTLSLGDLGVEADRAGEAGSRTEVYAIGDPPPRGETQRIDDDGSGAEKIVEFLLERRAL